MRPKETLSIVIMVHFGKGRFKDMYISAKPELFRLANHMRHEPTEAEQTLWNELRKFRSKGYVFRRQHPIDFYIADFYCHKVKLVIEVDGGIHSKVQNIEYDDNRSGELERYGIRVIRFKNAEILNDLEVVLSRIKHYLNETASPLSQGAGDGRG